jgi:hypothetical protein
MSLRAARRFVLALPVVLVACGKGSEPASRTEHTIDEPTRGTDAWMWRSTTTAEYDKVVAPLVGLDAHAFLPQSHALVQRVQQWVDRLDRHLREQSPEALANVPTPIARVIEDSTPNAFVAAMPVCYTTDVRLASGTPTASTTVDAVMLDTATGAVQAWPDELACAPGGSTADVLPALVARFNAHSDACQVAVGPGGATLAPGSACERGSELDGMRRARKVVVLQTANVITVHTGLFATMTESEFVAVIAHELGHFYRSHATSQGSEYDFFYTLGRRNSSARPVAEPALRELGESAAVASTLLAASDEYATVQGQAIRSELFFAVGTAMRGACAAGDCPAACESAVAAQQSGAFLSGVRQFPFGSETASLPATYRSYEAKSLQCLDQIALGAGTEQTADTIGWQRFMSYVAAPQWPSWLANLDDSTLQFVASALQLASLRIGTPTGATLGDAVRAASEALNQQDADGIGTLREAHERHLGFYTAEQEADEESIEWITDLGLAPDNAVNAMISLGAEETTSLRGLSLGGSDCDGLRQASWLDADGSYSFVPVGDYSEVHHSTCYRVFNMAREIEAHGYHAATDTPPLAPTDVWTGVQRTARGLLGAPSGRPGPVFAAARALPKAITDNVMRRCPWASAYASALRSAEALAGAR